MWSYNASEKLEGFYRYSEDTSDRFSNGELGFGADCAYRHGQFGLFGGAGLATGDLDISHQDYFLDGTLYAPQLSFKGQIGATIFASSFASITAHAGTRLMPDVDFEIRDLWIKFSNGTLNMTSLAKKHIQISGALTVWEAGGSIRFYLYRSISTSLDVMWQRYQVDLSAKLDNYATGIMAIYGSAITSRASLRDDIDFVLMTPEIGWCVDRRICASVSMPLAVMSGDRWIRGGNFKLSVPFF